MKRNKSFAIMILLIGFAIIACDGESVSSDNVENPVPIDENTKIVVKYFKDKELTEKIPPEHALKANEYFRVEYDYYDRKKLLEYYKTINKNKILQYYMKYIYDGEKPKTGKLTSVEHYDRFKRLIKERFYENGEQISYCTYQYNKRGFLLSEKRYLISGIPHGAWRFYKEMKIIPESERKRQKELEKQEKQNKKVNPNKRRHPKPVKYESVRVLTKEEIYDYGKKLKELKFTYNDNAQKIKEEAYENEKLLYSYTFDVEEEEAEVEKKKEEKVKIDPKVKKDIEDKRKKILNSVKNINVKKRVKSQSSHAAMPPKGNVKSNFKPIQKMKNSVIKKRNKVEKKKVNPEKQKKK